MTKHAEQRTICAVGTAIAVLWAGTAGALTAADICVAKKLKVSGKYAYCRMKVASKGVLNSVQPDFSGCDAKLAKKWAAIESEAAGACPADDGSTARSTTTGLLCGNAAGVSSSRFANNGDGTTTDAVTGLTWENKSYFDNSVHDVANTYTWADAASVHVAALNTMAFAGHTDWRVPNVDEMVSLYNFAGATGTVKGYPEFDYNCDTMGNPSFLCDVLTCSCGFSELWGSTTYWTSVANPSDPTEAFSIRTDNFHIDPQSDKIWEFGVIGVRGGNGL
jgi:hypothetical protein